MMPTKTPPGSGAFISEHFRLLGALGDREYVQARPGDDLFEGVQRVSHLDLFLLLLPACVECAAVPVHGMHDDLQLATKRHVGLPHG